MLCTVAALDHAKNDCFVCAVLSHGDERHIWGIDEPISLDVIKEPFKGPQPNSLKEKPKIFFIQVKILSKDNMIINQF